MQFRPTVADIDLSALRENLRTLKGLLPRGVDWYPMVKADAYGHGVVPIAHELEVQGVTGMGVSLIEEGIQLREAGIQAPLLLFGPFDRGGSEIVNFKLTPVISTFTQIEVLAPFRDQVIPVHLKLNTGMNRLGFSPDEFPRLQESLRANPHLRVQKVLTHLHSGEDADGDIQESYTAKQFRLFHKMAEPLLPDSRDWHIWSTGALLKRPAMKANHGPHWPTSWENLGARPGLCLYGVNPYPASENSIALKPVMTLRSQLMRVTPIKRGEIAGYGATYRADRDGILGVVPLGYADGYLRSLSNTGMVLVNGERARVVGRISMDFVLVELSSLARPARVGDEVILFGRSKQGTELEVRELAELAGTIPWELLTSVSRRVPRQILGVS